jgi:hypothetical protein
MAQTKIRQAQISGGLDGWIPAEETWTYASADAPTFVITVPSGAASRFSVGMKIKLTQTTVKYFIITAVADTTLTVYGGTDYTLANATITAPFYSMVRSPQGFPMSPLKWTQSYSDTTNRIQSSPTNDAWYNINSASLSVPIGVWNVDYSVFAAAIANQSGTTDQQVFTTLSTTNNTETLGSFSCRTSAGAAAYTSFVAAATHQRMQVVERTTKASYYLLTRCYQYPTTTVNQINNNGAQSQTLIRAICAYL